MAFAVESRNRVDAFHRAAAGHRGRDAGAPGIRDEYDPHDHGAFVTDPDGNKLEAVTLTFN